MAEEISIRTGDATQLVGIQPNAICQKVPPMLSLCLSSYSLLQLKIIDIYISRINSHYSNGREVVFSKKDLEKHTGKKKINTQELANAVAGLGQPIIKENERNIIKGAYNLFNRAVCGYGPGGQIFVQLICSEEAMRYFFFDDYQTQYFKHALSCVIGLTSMYSYRLFMYLLPNQFKESWTVDVQTLKGYLQCFGKTYDSFREFNSKILKPARDELWDVSGVKFDYEVIKKWRSAIAIRFTMIEKIPGTVPLSSKSLPGDSGRLCSTANGRQAQLTDESEDEHDALAEDVALNFSEGCTYTPVFGEEETLTVYELLGHNVSLTNIEPILRHVSDWNHTAFRTTDFSKPIKEARNDFLVYALQFHMRCRNKTKGSDGMVSLESFIKSIDIIRGREGMFGF